MLTRQYSRVLKPSRQSFFLLGPRGTGKTTWLKDTFPEALQINLLEEKRFQNYLGDANLFAREMQAVPNGTSIVIDEIQRIPSLLNEVYRFIEEKKFQFILSGSSARKLKKNGINLLAGRALKKEMFPFLPEELGNDFRLEEILRYGSLPVVWNKEEKREVLESYVNLYLKEEIQQEALVRNLPGFVRFLPIAGILHGQVVNTSNIARESEIARTTVSGYLEILVDTLLGFFLPAFDGKLRLKERKHPKFYFIDPGIPRALKKQFSEPGIEEKGFIFEGWIAALLKSYQSYNHLFDHWYYWQPLESPNLEVDFLLEKENQVIAIEVKTSTKIKSDFFKGLQAIAKEKKVIRKILLYLGDSVQKVDGIEILPLRDFLTLLEKNKLFL